MKNFKVNFRAFVRAAAGFLSRAFEVYTREDFFRCTPKEVLALIQSVVKNATVPVIETGAGNCHIYVDASADLEMAVRVCDNAKTSRPSVCNAVETVLVHREIAAAFLPRLKEALDVHHVELRGCARTAALIPGVVPAAGGLRHRV